MYYNSKVIVTNKNESVKAVILFPNGRGSQEAILSDAKGFFYEFVNSGYIIFIFEFTDYGIRYV